MAKIVTHKRETDSEFQELSYYLYALLSFLADWGFSFLISFILYHLFNINYMYLIIWFPFIVFYLRQVSGGSHATTPASCFIYSIITYLFIGIVSVLSVPYIEWIYIISAICFLLTYNKVPKYTKNATKHSIEKRIKLKESYIIRAFILFVLSLGFYFVNLPIFANTILVSLLVVVFNLTDISSKLLKN